MLYSLTNHSRHNELTAIRAAGVSLARLSIPYFIMGALLGLMVFAMNELCVPQADEASKEILSRRISASLDPAWIVNVDFHNESQHRYWHFDRLNRHTSEMVAPTVSCGLGDGSWLVIHADRGVYTNGLWLFRNVDEWRKEAPKAGQPAPQSYDRRRSMLVMRFSETPALIKSEVKISKMSLSEAAKRPQLSLREILTYLHLHPGLERERREALLTQLQGRIAQPFTCLAVVLIALPFGVRGGRHNVFVGVASSIFICFGYFILQRISFGLGIGGYLPPLAAAWLPNLACGLIGLSLLWRLS
jgi:lipopolysaccharide export system permease protein